MKKKKWKCGCGDEFTTKNECETHIEKAHWEEIRTTAGLASLRYHCEKIEKPLAKTERPKIPAEVTENMMKGTIAGTVLKEWSKIFYKLDTEEAIVDVRKDGWYVIAVDPANVLLTEVLLSRTAWHNYDFDETVTFGIDMEKVYKYASDYKKGELVDIVIDPAEEYIDELPRVIATFHTNGELVRTFAPLDPVGLRKKPKLPALQWETTVKFYPEQLENIKKTIGRKDSGEVVNIALTELGGVPSFCVMVDSDQSRRECIAVDAVALGAASVYSHDYMRAIFGLFTKDMYKTATNVLLKFAFEYPLQLSYGYKGIETKIIFASRIDGDEDEATKAEREGALLRQLRGITVAPEEEVEPVAALEIVRMETVAYLVSKAKKRLKGVPKELELYRYLDWIHNNIHSAEWESILNASQLQLEVREEYYYTDRYGGEPDDVKVIRSEPANVRSLLAILQHIAEIEFPATTLDYYDYPAKLGVIPEPEVPVAPEVPEEEDDYRRVKVFVYEDIPTFIGIDERVYKLVKGTIADLPKLNADILVRRDVARYSDDVEEPVVPEVPVVPEKKKEEKVTKEKKEEEEPTVSNEAEQQVSRIYLKLMTVFRDTLKELEYTDEVIIEEANAYRSHLVEWSWDIYKGKWTLDETVDWLRKQLIEMHRITTPEEVIKELPRIKPTVITRPPREVHELPKTAYEKAHEIYDSKAYITELFDIGYSQFTKQYAADLEILSVDIISIATHLKDFMRRDGRERLDRAKKMREAMAAEVLMQHPNLIIRQGLKVAVDTYWTVRSEELLAASDALRHVHDKQGDAGVKDIIVHTVLGWYT